MRQFASIAEFGAAGTRAAWREAWHEARSRGASRALLDPRLGADPRATPQLTRRVGCVAAVRVREVVFYFFPVLARRLPALNRKAPRITDEWPGEVQKKT